jgi:hypothetical protein
VLTESERETLEAVAEILLPGSVQAGVAWFIDEQLAKDPNESLLIARYFHVHPPYAGFYKGSIQAIDGFARNSYDKAFHQLETSQQQELVGKLFPEQPQGWQGPPAPLVYLCLRNDVVDAMYGTMEGFEKLDIPYMAHIEPQLKW